MPHAHSLKITAAALGLALASLASAQTAPPPGPGQTGILIGRQAGAPADHKDALNSEAHKGTILKSAPDRTATGKPTTLPAPALRAMGGGGQDPAGGGQQPPGQGPDNYRAPGAQMAGQDRVQDGRGPGGPVQSRAGGAVRAHDGQSGSGVQNPLGVQVRQQNAGTAGQPPLSRAATGSGAQGILMAPGRAAGSAQTRGSGVPGQDLVGQPNPAAAQAAEAANAVR
jgi:hypothetical protein